MPLVPGRVSAFPGRGELVALTVWRPALPRPGAPSSRVPLAPPPRWWAQGQTLAWGCCCAFPPCWGSPGGEFPVWLVSVSSSVNSWSCHPVSGGFPELLAERVPFLCRALQGSGSAGPPALGVPRAEDRRRLSIRAGCPKLVNLGGQTRFKLCLVWTLGCVCRWAG